MTIRLGVLAVSRIAEPAVVVPARVVDGVEIIAVAARDLDRAAEAARRWGAPHAYGSYRELVDSSEVNAIYIATPASLHREWAVATLDAGKHLLCEKPLAANADDARLIAAAAVRAAADGVVAMEAYHWRYHPYVGQMRDVIDSGELGTIRHVSAAFELPVGALPRDDIRWNLPLGGGSTMDLGCYPIQWVRWATGAEPDVVSATASTPVPGIDASLSAELRWANGITGRVSSSIEAAGFAAWLRVEGERGTMHAVNPLAPQDRDGGVITVETADGTRIVESDRSTTYSHQLVAFRDAIVHGAPFPTTIEDGVANMEVVDACYRAAGLDVRPTFS